jgi:3-oxoacyl-[acyl-carrier-protein] synthase II
MASRVAVTGVGAVTCLGNNAVETWNGLAAGRSGIHRIDRFPSDGLKTTICGTLQGAVGEGSIVERTRRIAHMSLAEALTQAGLPLDGEIDATLAVGATGWEFEWSHRREQQRAAGNGGPGAFLAQYQHRGNRDDFVRDDSLASSLQERFAIRGPAATVTTACASGGSAIELAVHALRRGRTRIAIAGAADASVEIEGLTRFSLLSALSRANDVPERASKPFSKNRDGFVMAEGAGFLVLEDEDHARRRGAEILGFVLGVGSNADAFHRTRSRPDGSSGAKCVAAALADAGLPGSSVEYVNAHGTSTPENDKMETLVLKAVFGEHAPKLLVSSNKSMLGHCLAAAGAVEAVATVMTLREGRIPPTINYEEPDPQLDLDYVPNVAIERRASVAISNSFGFGGQNVSVVFGSAATK